MAGASARGSAAVALGRKGRGREAALHLCRRAGRHAKHLALLPPCRSTTQTGDCNIRSWQLRGTRGVKASMQQGNISAGLPPRHSRDRVLAAATCAARRCCSRISSMVASPSAMNLTWVPCSRQQGGAGWLACCLQSTAGSTAPSTEVARAEAWLQARCATCPPGHASLLNAPCTGHSPWPPGHRWPRPAAVPPPWQWCAPP